MRNPFTNPQITAKNIEMPAFSLNNLAPEPETADVWSTFVDETWDDDHAANYNRLPIYQGEELIGRVVGASNGELALRASKINEWTKKSVTVEDWRDGSGAA